MTSLPSNFGLLHKFPGIAHVMRQRVLLWVVLWVYITPVYLFRLQLRPFSVNRPTKCQTLDSFDAFDKIPSWLKGNCKKLGFITPTEVQMRALPRIFAGKDVVVQAHTGSGKTLVYSLPILSHVDPSHAAIQAVIVVPTRELGLQVTSVLKKLASGCPAGKIGVMSVVEGSKNRRQIQWATAEPPHIVVGNPKALQRLVDMGRLRLQAVDMVVLDEVDACIIEPETKKELHKLLSRNLSGTYMSVEEVMYEEFKPDRVHKDHAKKHIESLGIGVRYSMTRQTIMCSATIPQRQHFAASCHKNGWTATVPELINVSEDLMVPPQVKHMHIPCPAELRLSCLATILKSELKNGVGVVSSAVSGGTSGANGVGSTTSTDDTANVSSGGSESIKRNTISGAGDVSTSREAKSPPSTPTGRFARLITRKRSISGEQSAVNTGPPLSDSNIGSENINYNDSSTVIPSGTTTSTTPVNTKRRVYTKQAIVFLDEKQQQDVNVYAATIIAALNRLESIESSVEADKNSDGTSSAGGSPRPTDTTAPATTHIPPTAGAVTISQRAIDKQTRVGVLQESMTLDARARTLDAFRDGESQVLVCSDMAARGLDVPSTSLVIQMSLPNRVEKYVHRAGRTGRLDRPGKVISFTYPEEAFVVQRFSNELGVPITAKNIKNK